MSVPETKTYTVDVPGAVLTYDIHEPSKPGDHPPLFIFGFPMGASGFEQLVAHFDDRTVVTYDPRMMERSHLKEGGEVTMEIHGDDIHRVAEAAGLGASGRVRIKWRGVGRAALGGRTPRRDPHPGRARASLAVLLADSEMALKVTADIVDTYRRRGFGLAMAKFIQLVMHPGP